MSTSADLAEPPALPAAGGNANDTARIDHAGGDATALALKARRRGNAHALALLRFLVAVLATLNFVIVSLMGGAIGPVMLRHMLPYNAASAIIVAIVWRWPKLLGRSWYAFPLIDLPVLYATCYSLLQTNVIPARALADFVLALTVTAIGATLLSLSRGIILSMLLMGLVLQSAFMYVAGVPVETCALAYAVLFAAGASGWVALGQVHALVDNVLSVERERRRTEQEAAVQQSAARERVEALNVELATLNAQLEARVRERTAELQTKNVELAELDRRKDELVATVSHDFRSPLAVIRQNVQTVLRDLSRLDHDDLRDLLKGVERQEARLNSMCSHLLDLARLKQNRVARDPVDLEAVAASHVEGLRMRAGSVGVKLECVVEPDAPVMVMGDGERLSQVVQNLVDNALKFTPAGGSVRLRLAPAEMSGTLCFEVEDSGCGIPPESIPRLFEPFYQVPSSPNVGQGSGLGLAIVRAVAEAHGGSVSVRSVLGKGTAFSLRVPAAQRGGELASA